jgi:hypothetical protein
LFSLYFQLGPSQWNDYHFRPLENTTGSPSQHNNEGKNDLERLPLSPSSTSCSPARTRFTEEDLEFCAKEENTSNCTDNHGLILKEGGAQDNRKNGARQNNFDI